MNLEKDAIKDDVSEDEQKKIVEAARAATGGARLEGMQNLAEQHREAREAEMAEQSGQAPEQEDELEDDSEDESEEETTETEEQAEETRILKVNGEDVEVPLSKIQDAGVRTLQKEASADQRLAEATRLLNEAKERTANPPSQDVGNIDSSPSNEDAGKLAKTLIDGDIEEVTEAVQKLMGAGRNSQEVATQVQNMDRSQIFNFVQDAMGIDKALAKFKDSPENGGFSDLYNDETLQKMVTDKEEALFQADCDAGISRTPTERLTEAATEVRNWRSGIIKTAGIEVSGFDDRKSKKQSSNSTIDGSGGRETSKRAAKPKTRSEVRKSAIEKMAAARGQSID